MASIELKICRNVNVQPHPLAGDKQVGEFIDGWLKKEQQRPVRHTYLLDRNKLADLETVNSLREQLPLAHRTHSLV